MASQKKFTVLLAEDHPIVRDGLRAVLEESGEFEVVGEAGDGAEAVELAKDLAPDVVVMDLLMPRKDGVDACREIVAASPDTRVLVLTASTEDEAVIDAVAAGAVGYLQKFSGKADLLGALREVAAGGSQFPGETVKRVFTALRGASSPGGDREGTLLTDRELEILRLFATGKSYAQIAEIKGNSPVTIRNAFYRIEDKLGVRTKQEVVVWAVRNGLLDGLRPEG